MTRTARPAHRPITPRPARGLRADDVSCGQWRAAAQRGPAWRDRASPSRAPPLAQFELRAALIGGRPRRLFLAGYLRRGPPRAGGVGARRCAAERLSAPAARPRVRPPRSPSPPSRPGRPGPVPPARTPAPAPSRAAQCAAGGPVPAGPRAPCPCLPLSGLLQRRCGSASSAPALLRSSVRPPGLLRPRAPRRRASPCVSSGPLCPPPSQALHRPRIASSPQAQGCDLGGRSSCAGVARGGEAGPEGPARRVTGTRRGPEGPPAPRTGAGDSSARPGTCPTCRKGAEGSGRPLWDLLALQGGALG